jgi:hypothetical protein
MAKVIAFPRRPAPVKSAPERTADVCACGHKDNVHIRHPSGAVSCVARGCRCETRSGS